MMTPLNRPATRSFDVDRYLEGQPQPTPLGLRFRAWAIRLNAVIERADFKDVALRFEKVAMGFVLSGAAVYLMFSLADAWLQGYFNIGGAR